jgi:hypothetical protein
MRLLKALPGRLENVAVVELAPRATYEIQRPAYDSVTFVCGIVQNVFVVATGQTSVGISSSSLTSNGLGRTNVKVTTDDSERARVGDVVHVCGRFWLRDVFQPISLSYDYTHEIRVSPQLGRFTTVACNEGYGLSPKFAAPSST